MTNKPTSSSISGLHIMFNQQRQNHQYTFDECVGFCFSFLSQVRKPDCTSLVKLSTELMKPSNSKYLSL